MSSDNTSSEAVGVVDQPIDVDTSTGLFGVLSTHQSAAGSDPSNASDTGAVILSAGLLHRVGPFRLHVELARSLAAQGIPVLRLDQSGKGDSPPRSGVNRAAGVLADIEAARNVLETRTGVSRVVLLGLCSGADDIVNYAPASSDLAGIVLFDGYATRNRTYYLKRFVPKLLSPSSWLGFLRNQSKQKNIAATASADDDGDAVDIREWGSEADMLGKLAAFDAAGVPNLSVFTSGVMNYYVYKGQLRDNLRSTGQDPAHLTEVFFSGAKHLYPLTAQRAQLVATVTDWLVENSRG